MKIINVTILQIIVHFILIFILLFALISRNRTMSENSNISAAHEILKIFLFN